ncbi:MAG: haloacid dehalogenase type II [Pseudomonadota bacterium]|nr:MAG: haloacid dehalogenase type II [Pseudomonadota bacterium]
MPVLENIEACVFDAYGTLFDVHSSVARHRDRAGSRAEQMSRLWRQKQLEYSWLRSLMGLHADFWQVTGEALDYALDAFDLREPQLRADLMEAYRTLDCYPEVPDILQRIKARGLQTAVLSNGSPTMLSAAIEAGGIGEWIDAVYSVETSGVYKPAPMVYQLAVDGLEVPAAHIAFQSANGWDIAGAAAFGYQAVWINRYAQNRERLPYGPVRELNDLGGLPALLFD